MLIRVILFTLVALGGAGLTLQMVWNARLRASTGSPVLTTIISVIVTLLSLILVWGSGTSNRGSVPAFSSIPTWAWFGGVFAAYYLVASLIAIPRLGAAAVFSLVITGQMLAALILDSTGAFGVTQIDFNMKRFLGVALLLSGVVLIQSK
jgi:transporter family-2 protein